MKKIKTREDLDKKIKLKSHVCVQSNAKNTLKECDHWIIGRIGVVVEDGGTYCGFQIDGQEFRMGKEKVLLVAKKK